MFKRKGRPASLAVFAALITALAAGRGARVEAQGAPAQAAPVPPPAAPSAPAAAPAPAAPAVPAVPAAAPAPASAPAPAPAPAPRTIIPAPPPAGAPASDKVAPAALEALVAPVALYPDPLLGQLLVAATYPLEIVQAQQWIARSTDLKGDALLDAAQKQPWDPSVQSMVAFPDVLKRLSENISWTTDLGNAFLAQQSDVMDAVQRLRLRAKQEGKLTSGEQQTVSTKQVEQRTVVEIQPTSTQVVYVPVYNPTVVWGPPVYPYPPVYYPPPPPAGAMLVSFGIGMAVGAAISHGGWGYGCGWGHSNVVVVNHHNTVVHHNDVNRGNVHRQGGSSNWQHDASHRGKVPYSNSQLADKYGGSARAPRHTPQTGARDRASRPGSLDSPRGLAGDNRAGAGSPRPATRESGPGSQRGGSDFGSERGGGGFGSERGGGDFGNQRGGGDFGNQRGGGGFGNERGGGAGGGHRVSPGGGGRGGGRRR
jgi:uncharacterized membrane protein YgcG